MFGELFGSLSDLYRWLEAWRLALAWLSILGLLVLIFVTYNKRTAWLIPRSVKNWLEREQRKP